MPPCARDTKARRVHNPMLILPQEGAMCTMSLRGYDSRAGTATGVTVTAPTPKVFSKSLELPDGSCPPADGEAVQVCGV
ncbi:hypothetical protein C0Q70_15024 [Pomacea canaliculata]|uniref:Uncharacterized protein n=1 Tax=Pomacea canaliculata TaxID=400727 RepID=A0A2T7NTQ3_POMCA|nr:hypothetical protein C0Q70_15024 [Pomacea canaliculata]